MNTKLTCYLFAVFSPPSQFLRSSAKSHFRQKYKIQAERVFNSPFYIARRKKCLMFLSALLMFSISISKTVACLICIKREESPKSNGQILCLLSINKKETLYVASMNQKQDKIYCICLCDSYFFWRKIFLFLLYVKYRNDT